MHTFKFHLTEAMLLRAYDAIQQQRSDEPSETRAGKMYGLEISLDLPNGVDAYNLQMKVAEYPFSGPVPSADAEIESGKMRDPYIEQLERISETEFKKLMYGSWVDNLSPLAQSILDIITESTQPPKSSYIAGWTICDKLGISRTELDCSFTEHDRALKELIDAGLVEELPDLGCRYRLKKQEQEG
jgi:hypothetical protein